ncbi:hypothetical protein CWO91_27100 [Bradyrhizobium genosp. SA-3]|nr:hypothetical protein CWO91_27100 [Bradyrhizobium genosp. SA-3]
MARLGLGARRDEGAPPRPLAGEGWGEGCFHKKGSPRGESPHPRLRRDLSRKRERLTSSQHRAIRLKARRARRR